MEPEPTIIITIATIATVVIALFTIAMFILQWRQHTHDKKVSNADYKLKLYDKRLSFLLYVESFFQNVMRDGKPQFQDALQLRNQVRFAKFLLPQIATNYFDEIVRMAFLHQEKYLIWEPLRKRSWEGEDLSPEEQDSRDKALTEIHDIQKWYFDQFENDEYINIFNKYLQLPNEL